MISIIARTASSSMRSGTEPLPILRSARTAERFSKQQTSTTRSEDIMAEFFIEHPWLGLLIGIVFLLVYIWLICIDTKEGD